MTRENTIKLLDLINDGVVDSRQLARDLLNYMSEAEVTDFAHTNGWLVEEDDDIDE